MRRFILTIAAFLMMMSLMGVKAEASIKKVTVHVKTYGSQIQECMIDHIILEYSSPVSLPKSAGKRKKLYTFTDRWYGGTRKIKAVYTNNKAKTRASMKSKKGRFVIVQFQPIENPSYDSETFQKGLHAGNATQYVKEEDRSYKRFNYNATIEFTQNKNLYTKNGKLVKKAGRIKIKNKQIQFDDVTYPKIITDSVANTTDIPFSYRYTDHKKKGTVEKLSYETVDYTTKDGVIYKKEALVYLPYGYYHNPDKKYPILYYMHGTGGSIEGSMNMHLDRLMDNMIQDGMIEPIILVCCSYYTNNPDKDREKGFREQDVYDQEFRNDLVRAVESKYRTYAENVTDDGLKASRQYRAFTGLSAGAMVTWQELLDNSDLIANFIPLSGLIGNMYYENGDYIMNPVGTQMVIDRLEQLDAQNMSYRIVECCGTEDDQMTEYVKTQYQRFMEHPTLFTPDRYRLLWTPGCGHVSKAFDDGLYSALPMVFPGEYYRNQQ